MTATAPLDSVALSPLLRQALAHLPDQKRGPAARLSVMLEIGFGEMEAAKQLGLSWKAFDNLRSELQGGMVRALHSDGYTDGQVALYLGVSTSLVAEHGHEPACHRGMAGEPEAQCQCAAIRAQRARRGEHQEDDGDGERAGAMW